MMKWTPPTLETAPDTPELETDARGRVQADCCNRFVWPFVLQDMRALPGVPFDWMCDGCRSDWHRHLKPVDGGPPIGSRAEWRTRLMKAHGAPDAAVRASEASHDGKGKNPHQDQN